MEDRAMLFEGGYQSNFLANALAVFLFMQRW